jgi:hypothetical protein
MHARTRHIRTGRSFSASIRIAGFIQRAGARTAHTKDIRKDEIMTNTVLGDTAVSTRAGALADRLERGAQALIDLARTLTDDEWNTPLPGDGRKVGIVVHHVASVYPIEIELAQVLASGKPMVGVTWNDVHAMNAAHAKDNAAVTKALHRHRSTPRPRSHASSCWRIMRCATATITSRGSAQR